MDSISERGSSVLVQGKVAGARPAGNVEGSAVPTQGAAGEEQGPALLLPAQAREREARPPSNARAAAGLVELQASVASSLTGAPDAAQGRPGEEPSQPASQAAPPQAAPSQATPSQATPPALTFEERYMAVGDLKILKDLEKAAVQGKLAPPAGTGKSSPFDSVEGITDYHREADKDATVSTFTKDGKVYRITSHEGSERLEASVTTPGKEETRYSKSSKMAAGGIEDFTLEREHYVLGPDGARTLASSSKSGFDSKGYMTEVEHYPGDGSGACRKQRYLDGVLRNDVVVKGDSRNFTEEAKAYDREKREQSRTTRTVKDGLEVDRTTVTKLWDGGEETRRTSKVLDDEHDIDTTETRRAKGGKESYWEKTEIDHRTNATFERKRDYDPGHKEVAESWSDRRQDELLPVKEKTVLRLDTNGDGRQDKTVETVDYGVTPPAVSRRRETVTEGDKYPPKVTRKDTYQKWVRAGDVKSTPRLDQNKFYDNHMAYLGGGDTRLLRQVEKTLSGKDEKGDARVDYKVTYTNPDRPGREVSQYYNHYNHDDDGLLGPNSGARPLFTVFKETKPDGTVIRKTSFPQKPDDYITQVERPEGKWGVTRSNTHFEADDPADKHRKLITDKRTTQRSTDAAAINDLASFEGLKNTEALELLKEKAGGDSFSASFTNNIEESKKAGKRDAADVTARTRATDNTVLVSTKDNDRLFYHDYAAEGKSGSALLFESGDGKTKIVEMDGPDGHFILKKKQDGYEAFMKEGDTLKSIATFNGQDVQAAFADLNAALGGEKGQAGQRAQEKADEASRKALDTILGKATVEEGALKDKTVGAAEGVRDKIWTALLALERDGMVKAGTRKPKGLLGEMGAFKDSTITQSLKKVGLTEGRLTKVNAGLDGLCLVVDVYDIFQANSPEDLRDASVSAFSHAADGGSYLASFSSVEKSFGSSAKIAGKTLGVLSTAADFYSAYNNVQEGKYGEATVDSLFGLGTIAGVLANGTPVGAIVTAGRLGFELGRTIYHQEVTEYEVHPLGSSPLELEFGMAESLR